MAYDEALAERIRELIASERGIVEQKMFGGLAFLLHGNMSVAVSSQGGLLVHVAPERSGEMISKPHASLMQMGNRPPMKGWIRVAPEGLRTKRELAAWVSVGTDFGVESRVERWLRIQLRREGQRLPRPRQGVPEPAIPRPRQRPHGSR